MNKKVEDFLAQRITSAQLTHGPEWQSIISKLETSIRSLMNSPERIVEEFIIQGNTEEKAQENATLIANLVWDYFTFGGWKVERLIEFDVNPDFNTVAHQCRLTVTLSLLVD